MSKASAEIDSMKVELDRPNVRSSFAFIKVRPVIWEEAFMLEIKVKDRSNHGRRDRL